MDQSQENQLTPGQGLQAPVCCAASKPLRVPRRRPKQWEVGDVVIQHLTMRRDDDPEPPCILRIVTEIRGEKCEANRMDMNDTDLIESRYLLSVEDALNQFDRCADEMTIRSYREGRAKLEALASLITPAKEWLKCIRWWDENPEDRPSGFAVMREMISHNNEGLASTADNATPKP